MAACRTTVAAAPRCPALPRRRHAASERCRRSCCSRRCYHRCTVRLQSKAKASTATNLVQVELWSDAKSSRCVCRVVRCYIARQGHHPLSLISNLKKTCPTRSAKSEQLWRIPRIIMPHSPVGSGETRRVSSVAWLAIRIHHGERWPGIASPHSGDHCAG